MKLLPVAGSDSKPTARQLFEMAHWGARLLATPNDYKTYRMYRSGFAPSDALRFLSGPRAVPLLEALNRESDLLHDKLRFGRHFDELELPVPEILASIGETGKYLVPLRSEQEIAAFIAENVGDHLVLKPRSEGQGKGVRVLTGLHESELGGDRVVTFSNGDSEPLQKLVKSVSTSGMDWLIQRRLRQHEVLASLNSSSINTVRLGTFLRADGAIDFDFAVLRIGRPTSQIDGFKAGGVVVRLNLATGEFSSSGLQKSKSTLQEVTAHPDSGVSFRGLVIPFWDEVLRLAKEFAVNSGNNRFIGWDVAITPDGPVFLEGNHDWDVQLAQVGSSGLITDEFASRIFRESGFELKASKLPPFKPVTAARLLSRR